jgi:DNA-binding transcriptional LysR family regulator
MDLPPSTPGPTIETEPRFDLRDVRSFLAVAEELNFTRAAARLHVAQQSLSATIGAFERSLGVRLFIRSTRHVALTRAGEALLPAARRILSDVAEAVHAVEQAAAGQSGHLAIGVAVAAHGLAFIRQTIARFGDASPRVEVHVTGHDYSDPTAGLAGGSSDLAFVLGPVPDDVRSLTVLEELRHVMVPADHPLAGRTAVRAAELSGLPWLRVPGPQSPWTRFWFQHPLGEAATGPEVRSGVEWIPAIAAGRGFGYTLPTLAAQYLPRDIVAVPVVDLEPGRVVLAWPRGRADGLTEAFVRTAREALRDQTGAGEAGTR